MQRNDMFITVSPVLVQLHTLSRADTAVVVDGVVVGVDSADGVFHGEPRPSSVTHPS